MNKLSVAKLFVWMTLTAAGLMAMKPLQMSGGLPSRQAGAMIFLLVGMGALGLFSRLPRAPWAR
jgi:hypothetical protein